MKDEPVKDYSSGTPGEALLEFPKKGSSGSGHETAYSVEVRSMYGHARQLGKLLIDNRWQAVSFEEGPSGIPAGSKYYFVSRHLHLMGYPAAQALRWWLHADADSDLGGGLCLETRLVKHEIKYSFSEESVSAHAYIGGEDRSSSVPDWGHPVPPIKAEQEKK